MKPVASRGRWSSHLRRGLALAVVLAGCEPKLQVGDLVCPPSVGGGPGVDADGVFRACVLPSGAAGSAGSGGASSSGAGGEIAGGVGGADGDGGEVCPAGGALDEPNFGPLPAPWKTGFEAGLCNYEDEAGYCYAADMESHYRVVTSPVHSGTQAAAFDLDPSDTTRARHTRCVRQGVFPTEAYYGAWYYVPSELTQSGAHDWNLFHFQGGMPGTLLHNLWDVSMDDSAGNGLEAFIYDDVNNEHYGQTDPRPVPTDRWVHLEFYWKRATDATGEVALFQDGEEIVRRAGIPTDDSNFGEWYVGNYTQRLTEASAIVTVYVDDVTVRLPPL